MQRDACMGRNCQLIVCILVVLIYPRTEQTIISYGHDTLRSYSGISISQRLPCPQPSVDWVAIMLNRVKNACTKNACKEGSVFHLL